MGTIYTGTPPTVAFAFELDDNESVLCTLGSIEGVRFVGGGVGTELGSLDGSKLVDGSPVGLNVGSDVGVMDGMNGSGLLVTGFLDGRIDGFRVGFTVGREDG